MKATARGLDRAKLAYFDPQTGELKEGEEISLKFDDDSMVRDNWDKLNAGPQNPTKPAARPPSGKIAQVNGKLIDTGSGQEIPEGTVMIHADKSKWVVKNGDVVPLQAAPAPVPIKPKPMVNPGNVLGPRPQ
jgi:hypothetical protein